MADDLSLVYDFAADLNRFGDEVEDGAEKVLQVAADTTAAAIVIGNPFGPGIAVDTGFARSTFRIGVNAPAAAATQRPYISRRVTKPGTAVFPPVLDLAPLGAAQLGDTVFITSALDYPQFLEFEPKRRRYGPNKGASTVFLDPVESRFPDIVDDAADRVGYGAR